MTRATLHDHVVVYAAHFALYGALPATLLRWPGAAVEVFVTWLDRAQRAHMDRTEGLGQRYDRSELAGVRLELDDGMLVRRVEAYRSRSGALTEGGAPVRLAGIASSGSPLPALDQPTVLRRVHTRLAAEQSYTDFMRRIVTCFGFRHRAALRLQATAIAPPRPRRTAPGSP